MRKKILMFFCVLTMGISFPMLAQIGPEPPPNYEPDGPEPPPNYEPDGPEPPPPNPAPINQFLIALFVFGATYAGRKFYLNQNNSDKD